MLRSKGKNIIMTHGDYGEQLPIKFKNIDIELNDGMKLTITSNSGNLKITKEYSNIEDNTINLELTQAQSRLLTPNEYMYSVDWYRDNEFLSTLINGEKFTVEVKH